MPEFRKDPLVERWVIIASERAKRPRDIPERDFKTGSEDCPFCLGNESMTPPPVLVLADDHVQGKNASWLVRVVPNKYPALIDQETSPPWTGSLYSSMFGAGAHEVVIESPKHVINMAALSAKEIALVFHAYRERLLHWRYAGRWRYALIYKNQGVEAGATLAHGHSQITALPMVPREPLEEIEAEKKYFASAGRCAYCDMASRESEIGRRVVAENEQFIVFCPFASRVAGETWLLPRRHASCFEDGSEEDFLSFARLLRETLMRLNRSFHEPPFNYFLHTNPLSEPENAYCHWHLEILPRLHQLAGFELGSGCYMNPLPPEDAARLLRDAVL
jgi:UDPglucose--hexose-1-phosphate uridylyltransferase